MNEHSGLSTSVWMATERMPHRGPLQEDASADVCIVGAGIAGLTTAYLLGREGRSVIVVDDGPIAGGETERTTAHLSNAFDDRYFWVEDVHGREGARLVAASHTRAIDLIEHIARTEGIDCDFERLDGYLVNAPERPADTLDKELAAARRAGLSDVDMVDRAPLEGFDTGRALRFPRQGQFHPLKYLAGLVRCIERDGGRLFGSSHVSAMKGGARAEVRTTDGRTVRCADVVVATNTPINDLFAIHTKQAPYRTYVIGVRVPRGSVPRALYWDTLEYYHYVRLQSVPGDGAAGRDILIVGGEDHKTGQADDYTERHARLERWTRARFPMAEGVEFRWSGQVMEPVDGVAFIGRNPMDAENVRIITGDSGQGMTHGTIGGMLITDQIMGRHNAWGRLYDPSRKSAGSWREYAQENINAAAQYADYLKPGEVGSVDQIPPGAAAHVRRGAAVHACFRDKSGRLHECSAVCTHLGGVVRWNPLEQTWDCPVHGSRFTPQGEVVNGPAMSPLGRVEQRVRGEPVPGRREGGEERGARRPGADAAHEPRHEERGR